jgi:hypothetical protein
LDNYICYCDYNKETKEYDWNGKNIIPKRELARYSGVRERSIRKYDDFVETVIRSIDEKIPVIAGADVFYAAYRGEEREKKHWPHFILIYGYDRDKKVFTILEHMYLNSSIYKEMEVGFSVILECHNSFLEYYPKYDPLIEMRKVAIESDDFYAARLKCLSSSNRIERSLKHCETMMRDAAEALQSEYCEETAKRTLNNLLKAKAYSEVLAKKYEYQKKPVGVIEQARKSAYAYSFLWGIFAKYDFLKGGTIAMEKVRQKIETILLHGKAVWSYETEDK